MIVNAPPWPVAFSGQTDGFSGKDKTHFLGMFSLSYEHHRRPVAVLGVSSWHWLSDSIEHLIADVRVH
jgi:hypothetical protein